MVLRWVPRISGYNSHHKKGDNERWKKVSVAIGRSALMAPLIPSVEIKRSSAAVMRSPPDESENEWLEDGKWPILRARGVPRTFTLLVTSGSVFFALITSICIISIITSGYRGRRNQPADCDYLPMKKRAFRRSRFNAPLSTPINSGRFSLGPVFPPLALRIKRGSLPCPEIFTFNAKAHSSFILLLFLSRLLFLIFLCRFSFFLSYYFFF